MCRRKLEEQAPKRRKKGGGIGSSAPSQPAALVATAPASETWAKVRPHDCCGCCVCVLQRRRHPESVSVPAHSGVLTLSQHHHGGQQHACKIDVVTRLPQVPKSQKKKQKGKSMTGQQLGFSSGVNFAALEGRE